MIFEAHYWSHLPRGFFAKQRNEVTDLISPVKTFTHSAIHQDVTGGL
jgi:hypothetical protein